jgi:hypothetical protein
LLALIAFFIAFSSPAIAQHFSVGMKTGVATLKTVSTSGIFVSQSHPLVWGPAVEAALPYDLGIEVSALHRQIAYRWQEPQLFFAPPTYQQQETSAHSWELPFVLKKYLHTASGSGPFAEVGYTHRHTSSTTNAHGLLEEFRNFPPPPFLVVVGTFYENIKTPELVRSSSDGLVIGGGLDIKIRFLRLQPEFRYTRLSNATFAGTFPVTTTFGLSSLRSNRNTFDFLVGVMATR